MMGNHAICKQLWQEIKRFRAGVIATQRERVHMVADINGFSVGVRQYATSTFECL